LVVKEITDNLLLDLLAWQFHCDFYRPDMSIEIKQELILKSLDWHIRKGTPSVVEEIVSTVFSKAIVQEWFEYDGLPYRFRIATDEQIPDTEDLSKFLRAIKSVKNIRSFFDSITQLVYFLDEVITNELHQMVLQMKFADDFSRSGKIFHNARILRDGHTVRLTEKFLLFRNGTVKHDRSTYHKEDFAVYKALLLVSYYDPAINPGLIKVREAEIAAEPIREQLAMIMG
jgi:phage tail P2-like protein